MAIKILMTGGSGYIGSRLIPHLLSSGADVTTVGRRSVGGAKHRSIGSYGLNELRAVLGNESFDVLINLAAAGVNPEDRSARLLHEINALLASELIQLLAGRLGCAISVGSNAEYGSLRDQRPVMEDAALEWRKAYGSTKALGGLLALSAGHAYGVRTAHLRVFNVYGPGEAGHRLLPSIVRGLNSGVPVALTTGNQVRDFVHVNDVCEAMLVAAEYLSRGAMAGGVFNVCTGRGTSVREFARHVATLINAQDDLLKFGAIPMRADETPWLVGDPGSFRQTTGWTAKTELRDGLCNSVDEELASLSPANRATSETR